MSTPADETQTPGVGTPGQSAGRATTLVLGRFAAVYVVWGSTYLAIRIGIESFSPADPGRISGTLFVGLFLYPVCDGRRDKADGANWRTAIVAGALLLFVGNGESAGRKRRCLRALTALRWPLVSLWLVILDWLSSPAGAAARVLLDEVAGLHCWWGRRTWEVRSA